jgi:vacuolar protein sorting-associated protein 41
MGNTKQALRLITNELHDVNHAIEFCKEHNDHELWEDLISHSIDKPCMYFFLSYTNLYTIY